MVLYLLTKFGKIKAFINSPWLRSFDLRFFRTSKQIFGKLQYMEKFFGKFQHLPHFSRKTILYSSNKFCIFEFFINIQLHRRFDLGFWQTSEQVYRKLQYAEKILVKFQSWPRFPGKMVLCSLTKFGIIKTETDIPYLRRFNLHFFHTLKQIYRKLEKVLGKFQRLPRFPRKWFWNFSRKFYICELCTTIKLLRRC